VFGNHGLGGLLEEGAHEKSPKCLGWEFRGFWGILQRSLFEYAPNPTLWVDSLGLHKKKRCCNGDPCSGKNPSATARRWQGSDPYPGIDSYKNVVVKAGTVLYTLYPHGNTPGNYFVTAKDS